MADEPNLPDGWGKLNDGPLIDPRIELVRENANLRAEIAKLRAALEIASQLETALSEYLSRPEWKPRRSHIERARNDAARMARAIEQQRESGS